MPELTGYGLKGLQKEYMDRYPLVHHHGSAKRPKCGCGSWLNHWIAYAKGSRANCVYMGCNARAEDGAHVRFCNLVRKNKKGHWVAKGTGTSYIVPLCGKHNRSRFSNPFFVSSNCELIDDSERTDCKTTIFRLNRQNYFCVQATKSNGRPKCGCSSHFAHYRIYTGSSRSQCSAMGCSKKASGAAPLNSKDGRSRFQGYTAPLCRGHAKSKEEFYVKRKADICPPDQCDECGS